jgi:AraC-like DNA-binding protein
MLNSVKPYSKYVQDAIAAFKQELGMTPTEWQLQYAV